MLPSETRKGRPWLIANGCAGYSADKTVLRRLLDPEMDARVRTLATETGGPDQARSPGRFGRGSTRQVP